jgi:hypothetical protein
MFQASCHYARTCLVSGSKEVSETRRHAHSGGKAPQWGEGAFGADNVARLLATFLPWLSEIDVTIEQHPLNGQPGAIFRDRAGRVLNTWTVDILAGGSRRSAR